MPEHPTNTRLEAVARRFHTYEFGDPLNELAGLVHPDARMSFLGDGLGPLEGRQEIVAELTQSREAKLYSATIERCEWIDQWTLLLTGRVRYVPSAGGGLTDATVWWVDEFLDGMLLRIDVFTSADAVKEWLRSFA